ncbi:adenylate/guanylate cyclase domain-containing protein [Stigmatella aurantiaca]|uniref:Adenylate/guanylate cyclase n=1 Tax=Stigmatella aurantiaca (strain DW4/3-1) TaxID=378806 RepID=Q09AR0_STIAD|nr:adenylate/guanylate cyclase domain-containing protein [Stigmatella aurantiaca]ADO74859.1 Adenylate/guanylate cyclase domain protein [Stigmatella aurantiaca DW4/3-1]EAU68822.1 adenylate/guanylate cyclase [Stigmatella aurantiaca DW4/3-1]
MVEAPQAETRSVSAIMFTAMVSREARVPAEEVLEGELKEEHARLVRELLSRQGGREVKVTEDGFLLAFEEGLKAVQFGVALQEALRCYNAHASSERQMALRIGVHVGPVVCRGGDMFGEGVNLAARIEALARPGTLYVSEAVMKGHALPPALRLRRNALKGLRLPVEVFRIEPRGALPRPALFARVRSLIALRRARG